jgi:lipoprotein-releasing system permease protein
MNGFERDFADRILGMTPHISISKNGGGPSDWVTAEKKIKATKDVVAASPFLQRQAILQGKTIGVAIIRGVAPQEEAKVSQLASKIKQGSLSSLVPGDHGIILGKDLARDLGVNVGDTVTLNPREVRAAQLQTSSGTFHVVGIADFGFDQFDAGFAFIHIFDAQELFAVSGPRGVEVKITDALRPEAVVESLRSSLGADYHVSNWRDSQANLFEAMAIEKKVMFVILFLIVAVAAFNLVSTLVMLVIDKQSDIAILKTVGMSSRIVMSVFFFQGLFVGAIGIALGGVFGTLLALNLGAVVNAIENLLRVKIFSSSLFYSAAVPTEVRPSDLIAIVGASFVCCALATIYPAWRAAKTQPAAALRYE